MLELLKASLKLKVKKIVSFNQKTLMNNSVENKIFIYGRLADSVTNLEIKRRRWPLPSSPLNTINNLGVLEELLKQRQAISNL